MGYFTIAVLVLCAVFNKDGLAKKHRYSKSDGGKIVGGNNATIQDCPYQAFLLLKKGDNDYYQCGGSIISKSHVLSAAHCFEGIQSVKVRIGSTDKFSGGNEYTASYFLTHPQYDSTTKDYDIAVVRTSTKMYLDGTNSKAVTLVEKGTSIPSGSEIKISGWGAIIEGGATSNNLMSAEVPTLSNEECNQELHGITVRQFCAGYKEGGKDSCQGDSGGPAILVDSGKQVGVVSSGYGCAQPNSPGIYTNITTLRSWVKRNTGV